MITPNILVLLPKNQFSTIQGIFENNFTDFPESANFIFRQQENLVDNQKCQAGFRPLCKFVLQARNSISVCTLIITSNHLERNQGPKYLLFMPSELSSKDQNQWRKTKPIFVIRPERNGKKYVVGTTYWFKGKRKILAAQIRTTKVFSCLLTISFVFTGKILLAIKGQ